MTKKRSPSKHNSAVGWRIFTVAFYNYFLYNQHENSEKSAQTKYQKEIEYMKTFTKHYGLALCHLAITFILITNVPATYAQLEC
ncbi:MAG: hypothetical protein M3367_16820, partial [Acidobacteriota bacterium]|nr:hypothetical protein [Acidobacteriota bacterium]